MAVPYRDLIGEEGDQIWYVFQIIVPYFLMAMAGTYLGIVSAALDEAQAHLRRRRYTMSGSGPGSQSIIQHRLGTLWAQVERTPQAYLLRRDAGRPGWRGRAAGYYVGQGRGRRLHYQRC
ncbi:MAG: hypothetical protein KatS3mg057_0155 [Herpetosiphonaceae bacterium]|nr:MAG: hypothetical protein KatS3mg057_0155 [Herpetosiphonaceae bacterium]